jgi:2-polyprenyl-6-methoxyphenol hydroxylase-like FAD-dependent oxidoreductase
MGRHFEVVVVGSGPAGASTAIRLLRAGVTVSVVASKDTRSSLPGEALSPEVRTEFRRMGLEDDFPHEAMPSYGIEALWGQEIPAFHSHLCSPSGTGLSITRPDFHGALLRAVLTNGDCGFLSGQFLRAEKTSRGWTVAIRIGETTETLTSDLLADATGRTAAVARHLGARRCRFDSLCGISSVLDFPIAQQTLVVLDTDRQNRDAGLFDFRCRYYSALLRFSIKQLARLVQSNIECPKWKTEIENGFGFRVCASVVQLPDG